VSEIPIPAVRIVNGSVAVILVAQMLSQFHVGYFTLWVADAPAKRVAAYVRDHSLGLPKDSVSLSATWYMTPALQYYRSVYNIGALRPVERNDPTLFGGFDYYVLDGKDVDTKAQLTPDVHPIFVDKVSGVVFTP
jgi:hypothetical protein